MYIKYEFSLVLLGYYTDVIGNSDRDSDKLDEMNCNKSVSLHR